MYSHMRFSSAIELRIKKFFPKHFLIQNPLEIFLLFLEFKMQQGKNLKLQKGALQYLDIIISLMLVL